MKTQLSVIQNPVPGESKVMYCGDIVAFELTLSCNAQGKAFVRTNLGSAKIARKEIINRVEKGEIKLDEAWYDIEMEPENDTNFKIILPLHETGFFQVKCFFIPENHTTPVWPKGDNCILNVEPAGTICGNIIYNAFVRQFAGLNSTTGNDEDLSSIIKKLDKKGYTVIPESGKFRDLKAQVEFIFTKLGCRILHLLPIHPTPTTYARMGRFGSPYAALNFTEVDPALARFDLSATPMEQFMELVDMVHFYNGYIFMDIAINHTGWAASIHESNPEWLVRDDDGEIQAPGAWGVVWADLTRLDYSQSKLWEYMADVFLLWCHRGVDGFRCDAGYMIPVNAWEYIVAKVRLQYPETLFFLEGLGGPIKTTCDILGKANFNWAYSELFQNYSRDEISNYLPQTFETSNFFGTTIHFAETHDNNRLASVSKIYAKMRTSLCALFSVAGGFGFANGVEWFATQKIDVHELSSLNWGDKNNQVEHIFKLNLILKDHPCFIGATKLELIQNSSCEGLVLLRFNESENKKLLIVINLDCENTNEISWSRQAAKINEKKLHDLISENLMPINIDNEVCSIQLSPGEVMVLTPDADDLILTQQKNMVQNTLPKRVYFQKLKAKVLLIHTIFNEYGNLKNVDIEGQALSFCKNPGEFIRSFNKKSDSTKHQENRVIIFDISKDIKRQIMIPPGFFLLIKCKSGFRAHIIDEDIYKKKSNNKSNKESLGYEEGLITFEGNEYFALFSPKKIRRTHKQYILNFRIFKADSADSQETRIENASLLYLAPFNDLEMNYSFTRKEIVKKPSLKLMAATNKGGMMRAAAFWGKLDSKYDAFLGANMDDNGPENRWMVFSRCRIWAIFQGYSRELVPDCLEKFTFSYDHGGRWLFHIPTSEGKYYVIKLYLTLDPEQNRICLAIERGAAQADNDLILEDDKAVTIIMRPDIEDRSFHEPVKAFKGPETKWPAAVNPVENGFSFLLENNKKLEAHISKGQFIHEPEWHYMVHHPVEVQRGLDPDSDLFSPGYFTTSCLGKERIFLNAGVYENQVKPIEFKKPNIYSNIDKSFEKRIPLFKAVKLSLDAFIVDRGSDKSVIAGYPWFLDWGRDSLIFCRCLIELDRFAEAKSILRLFGRFENNGTLPNMICGNDAANIETSDAPLWFFACCKDLVKKEKTYDFLNEILDDRKVLDILFSIANSMIKGTKTGVKADPETMLLYSPSHFTWMDTNFPAGSPRQGYPIEIQALWFNALDFLSKIEMPKAIFGDIAGNISDERPVDKFEKKEWHKKAKLVQTSIIELFYNKKAAFFVDCLHANANVTAKNAIADDALRPNQLFLFTLDVIKDKEIAQKCVETCLSLIVPGAIRSLADQKVEYPVNIIYNDKLLKDPAYPYTGIYMGDEDTQRKPAYHNGTAWTWPFPVFCEAWAKTFGTSSYGTSLAWLGSVLPLMRQGAAGYIPEIIDGDYPHTPRGCDAQAWGSSEFARVMHKLQK